MKKIHLVRTDVSCNEVLILNTEENTHEVIFGSGTLECYDKRVSRNHCSLKILPDGGILLVAIHSNPCFYRVQSKSTTFTSLLRNESITLYQGDEFSLLPENFRFRISMQSEESGENRTATLESASDMLETTQNVTDDAEEVDNKQLDNMNQTSPAIPSTSMNGVTPSKRVLPDWLANLPQSTVTPPLSKARKRKLEQENSKMDKKQKNSYNESCKGNTNVHEQIVITPTVPDTREANASPVSQQAMAESSGNLNVLEPVCVTEIKERNVSPLPQQSNEDRLGTADRTQSNNKYGYEESWGVSSYTQIKIEPGTDVQENTEPTENQIPIKTEPLNEEPVDNTLNPTDLNHGASSSGTTAAPAASAREMCMYGRACYRRNPQHRTDFSHPGDTDYDAEADNLPECEYGTSCYRKNVQHRKDFKHTKKMSPPPPQPRPPQANSMAPNIYCRSCSIVYTVCSRCSQIGVHTHRDTVDLTEDDDSDEDTNKGDFQKKFSDKSHDKAS